MFQPGFRIRLMLSSLVLCVGLVGPSWAQSDDVPGAMVETRAEKSGGIASSFSKMFGRSDNSPASSSDKMPAGAEEMESGQEARGAAIPGKPSFDFSRPRSVPAKTTGSRGGGIFVPLRSFTNRVFRGGSAPDTSGLTLEVEQEVLNNAVSKDLRDLERTNSPRAQPTERTDESVSPEALDEIPATIRDSREVGSALKSNAPVSTPAKIGGEPFSGNGSTPSRTRDPQSGQRSNLLPPPPALPATQIDSRAREAAVPNASSRNNAYSGARSRSAAQQTAPPFASETPVASRAAAPIFDATPNLEEKSTSRRVPDRSEGIVESLEMPADRSGKPTSLVDLSEDRTQTLPTTITRAPTARNSSRQLVPESSVASDVASEQLSSQSSDQSTDEPSVTRHRVPDSRGERQSLSSVPNPVPSQSNATRPQSGASEKSGQAGPNKLTSKETVGTNDAALFEANQPGVGIQIVGPSAMVVGQEAAYELIAKNHGTSNLNGLIVRLALPNSVTIGTVNTTSGVTQPDREDGDNALLWEVEAIAAGQMQSLRLPLRTSSPEHFAMNVEWTALPQSQSLQVKVHEPKLDIALEGPAEAEYGVPLKYRLRIKNPGNAIAREVEVRLAAESFGSNQSVVGDIAPGGERIIDVELLFEQSGVIPIVASAASVASQVQAQSQIEVRVRQAKLVAKWEGANQYYQGSVGEYRLMLSNEGDAAINQAKCSLRIPEGADPIALPPGSVRRGDSVQWDVKKMMPGETVSVPLRFTFAKLGQATLIFKSETKNGASVEVSHAVIVDAIEDLNLAVIPPVAPAPVDQPVPYEIEIHNRGTKAAQNVAVLAQFSDGIEPVKVEGHEGQIVPGQVIFQSIPTIGPNERITLKVFAKASASGIHRFRAEVKGSSGESDLVQEGSTRYMAAGTFSPQLRR